MRDPIRFVTSRDFLPLHSFPHDARAFGSKRFLEAAKAWFERAFHGGTVTVQMEKDGLAVAWVPPEGSLDPAEYAVALLQRGNAPVAVPLLLGLLADRPEDPVLLYNLGMAESDLGRLDDAVAHLTALITKDPGHVNARVALGVAHARAGRTEDAIATLAVAVEAAPENPWARRNLAALLGKQGRTEEAVDHLREAVRLLPNDQQSLYGLAHTLVALGGTERIAEADELFRRAIDIDPDTELAEVCRKELSGIAHGEFRGRAGGAPRMDAVMYLAGAMKTFRGMSADEVRKVTFEIAMLGMKGFDVNDPARKYRLRSLPGEFSGLHLVCILDVGMKLVDPSADTGFDLSREYEEAKALFGATAEGLT